MSDDDSVQCFSPNNCQRSAWFNVGNYMSHPPHMQLSETVSMLAPPHTGTELVTSSLYTAWSPCYYKPSPRRSQPRFQLASESTPRLDCHPGLARDLARRCRCCAANILVSYLFAVFRTQTYQRVPGLLRELQSPSTPGRLISVRRIVTCCLFTIQHVHMRPFGPLLDHVL